MIWVPAISIIVFFLVLIPSAIIGWKKGWRSAVFFSVLLIALTGMFIGIGYGIYKPALWPIYKSTWLKSKINSGVNLDINALAPSYRPQVVLVFAAVMLPISYIITFGIYKIFHKKLDGYLMPQIKEVSQNEKELIYRKDAKVPKMVGAGVMTVTSLFTASFAASAANVFVTPSSHSNFFTKANDALARAYGFGQAWNTSTPEEINEMLKTIDAQESENIKLIAKFYIDESSYVMPTIDEVKTFLATAEQIDGVTKTPQAAEAIFESILKRSNTKINPLAFDQSTITSDKDANGVQVGYHQTNFGGDLTHVKTYLDSIVDASMKDSLLSIPANVRSAIMNSIISRTISFSETPFAQNVVQAGTNLSSSQQILNDRQQQLKSSKTNLSNLETAKESVLSENRKLSGNQDGEFNYTDVSQISGGTIQEAKDKLIAAQVIQKTKESELTTASSKQASAQNVFTTAERNYSPAKQAVDDADAKLASLKNDLSNENTALRTNTQLKSQAEQQLTELNNTLASKTVEYNKLLKDVGDLTSELTNEQNNHNVNGANNQATIDSLTKRLAQMKTTIQADDVIIKNLQSSISSKQSEIKRLESEISTVNQTISSLNQNIQSAQATLTSAQAQLRSVEPAYSQSKRELEDANTKLQTAQSNKKSADDDVKKYEDDIKSKFDTYVANLRKLTESISWQDDRVELSKALNAQITKMKNTISMLEGNGVGSIIEQTKDVQIKQTILDNSRQVEENKKQLFNDNLMEFTYLIKDWMQL